MFIDGKIINQQKTFRKLFVYKKRLLTSTGIRLGPILNFKLCMQMSKSANQDTRPSYSMHMSYLLNPVKTCGRCSTNANYPVSTIPHMNSEERLVLNVSSNERFCLAVD